MTDLSNLKDVQIISDLQVEQLTAILRRDPRSEETLLDTASNIESAIDRKAFLLRFGQAKEKLGKDEGFAQGLTEGIKSTSGVSGLRLLFKSCFRIR